MSEYITLDFEPSDRPNVVLVKTNQQLAPDGTEVYPDIDSGDEGSPLAQMLFSIDGVLALTLDTSAMTITYAPDCQLFTLIDEVRAVLTDFFL